MYLLNIGLDRKTCQCIKCMSQYIPIPLLGCHDQVQPDQVVLFLRMWQLWRKKRTIPTCSILNFQWLPQMLTGDIHHQWIGFFGKVVSPESLIFFMGKPGWENRFSDSLILNGKIDGFRFSDSPIARPIHWNHWRQKQVAENVWPLVHNEKLTSLEKFQVAWQDGVS